MHDVILSTNNPDVLQVVALLVSVVAPIIVGLITRVSTSGAVKGVLLALISALVGFGNAFLQNTSNFSLWPAVISTIQAFIIGVATYFGLWSAETSTGASVKKWAQRTLIKDAA